MRVIVTSLVVVACAFQSALLAQRIQKPKGQAIIGGTVVDEHHVPVAGARVQVFAAADVRKASDTSQPLGPSVESSSTDATGTFRISGLAAGDYIVAAEAMPTIPTKGAAPARAFGATFYPSTLAVREARVVEALDHQPATVRIELVPVTPVRVMGTIVSASGRSTEGFHVRLSHSFGGFGTGTTVAVVDAKGFFEIPRVLPGAYGLIIEPEGSRPGQEGREFVDTKIDVKDHDLDLSLTARPGASLTGRVVVEPPGTVSSPIGLQIKVTSPDRLSAASSYIAAPVNGDWSFRMTGLSGPYEFVVSSDRPPPIVAITRVVVDGVSQPANEDITLAEGEHEVVVFIASREAPKPTVDPTQPSSALVEQFKNEKVDFRQFEIAKALVAKQDASVLPPLADWLVHADRRIRGNAAFVFAGLGDPRGLQAIAEILTDRSERPEGQGTRRSPRGPYRFEQQVAADRNYAAHLLGNLRDPGGVDLLVPLFDDPETQDKVPWALGQIGDKRAIPPLIAALDKDDPTRRVMVIYALEALDAKEAVPRLLTLVNDNRQSRFGAGVTVSAAAKAAIAKLR